MWPTETAASGQQIEPPGKALESIELHVLERRPPAQQPSKSDWSNMKTARAAAGSQSLVAGRAHVLHPFHYS